MEHDSSPTLPERIDRFLQSGPFAVVGASRDRSKYGNKVLRAYLQRGLPVYAVNPRAKTVEGLTAYPDLSSLPGAVRGISIITPPEITEQVVEEAGQLGIEYVWMQPGAESPQAMSRARQLGMTLIAGGPCLLVVAGYRESAR